ncbi:hypothetical protein HVX13_14610 [Citrobacter freundii]|nr:hypothetical protein [Citrobacter freundii]MBA8332888.1 hypothetical protein [Citrobacter freundii]QLM87018.1 hypothetical protein HVX13_14610 [Citrobacter freundii]QMM22973.1 hypothetical protein HVX18_14600 [Citrobacter freundii]
MRRFCTVLVLLSMAYFIIGGLFAYLNKLELTIYLNGMAIVGFVMTIVCIYSLSKPAITQSDLEQLEATSLESITKTISELKSLKTNKNSTQEEILDLEKKRKEMELLVKKASMALFFREQLNYHERRILSEIKGSETLNHSLSEIKEIKGKLKALDEEIACDPEVEFLRSILLEASRRTPTLDELTEGMPFIFRIMARSTQLILGNKI